MPGPFSKKTNAARALQSPGNKSAAQASAACADRAARTELRCGARRECGAKRTKNGSMRARDAPAPRASGIHFTVRIFTGCTHQTRYQAHPATRNSCSGKSHAFAAMVSGTVKPNTACAAFTALRSIRSRRSKAAPASIRSSRSKADDNRPARSGKKNSSTGRSSDLSSTRFARTSFSPIGDVAFSGVSAAPMKRMLE